MSASGVIRSSIIGALKLFGVGGGDGLGRVERAAKYVVFLSRNIRSERHHAQEVMHDPQWPPREENSNRVYDLGANIGLNFEYYFAKGLDIIAVEANPALYDELKQKFADAVQSGRLRLVNACVSTSDTSEPVDFYVHRNSHVLSTMAQPPPEQSDDYERIKVATIRASDLFSQFGHPFYVKVDIEGLDGEVLGEIFKNYDREIAYISAEVHDIMTFSQLVSRGYQLCKVVEGKYVAADRYSIPTENGTRYRFPEHSAGPFGEDIPGEWINQEKLFDYLCEHGTGWKDIHAKWQRAAAR